MKNKNIKYIIAPLVLVIGLLALAGCAGNRPAPKQAPSDLVWPNPPDIPRIKFIASISSEEDIGGKKKKKLADLILGRDPSKVVKRLRKPYGVSTDSKGRIYVADSAQSVVFVFDRETGEVSFVGRKGAFRLGWPIDVSVDGDDNVYVSDVQLKNVLVFDAQGNFKWALAKKGTFVNPTGLVVDRKNRRLLVADSKTHQIKVFSLDGTLITTFGGRGFDEGFLNFPTNIAIDKKGFIYIVDTGNHRIQVFDDKYEYYDDFGTLGTRPGQFRRPKGIALDSENHIYVVDSDFNNFQIFNEDYQILMHVGNYGHSFGQFWLPAGVHIDEKDRIYVVDSVNRRVQIFQYLKQNED
jgi:sugar lactone lactonase YvrE